MEHLPQAVGPLAGTADLHFRREIGSERELGSPFYLQKFDSCVILQGMSRLSKEDRDRLKEKRRGDLLPTYGKDCFRCGYEWLPRVLDPERCPKCRSKYWATQRENRQGLRAGT